MGRREISRGTAAFRCEVVRALAKDTPAAELRARMVVVQRRLSDVRRFVRWPALEQSLADDLRALAARLARDRGGAA